MTRLPLVVVTVPRALILTACAAAGHVLGCVRAARLRDPNVLYWRDVEALWDQAGAPVEEP